MSEKRKDKILEEEIKKEFGSVYGKQIGLRISDQQHKHLKGKESSISETIKNLIDNDREKGTRGTASASPTRMKKTSPNKYDLLDTKVIKANLETFCELSGSHQFHFNMGHETQVMLRDKSIEKAQRQGKSLKETKTRKLKPKELFIGELAAIQKITLEWINQKGEKACLFDFDVACTYRVNRNTEFEKIQKYIMKNAKKDMYHFINQYTRASMDMFQTPRLEKMLPSSFWQLERM